MWKIFCLRKSGKIEILEWYEYKWCSLFFFFHGGTEKIYKFFFLFWEMEKRSFSEWWTTTHGAFRYFLCIFFFFFTWVINNFSFFVFFAKRHVLLSFFFFFFGVYGVYMEQKIQQWIFLVKLIVMYNFSVFLFIFRSYFFFWDSIPIRCVYLLCFFFFFKEYNLIYPWF